MHHLGERLGDLVGAGRLALVDLDQHVAPELEPHLGDGRVARRPGGTGHLEVEGIERKQPRTRFDRCGHGGAEPVGIAAANEIGTGGKGHRAGTAPARVFAAAAALRARSACRTKSAPVIRPPAPSPLPARSRRGEASS